VRTHPHGFPGPISRGGYTHDRARFQGQEARPDLFDTLENARTSGGTHFRRNRERLFK